jgi:hypothetical protein
MAETSILGLLENVPQSMLQSLQLVSVRETLAAAD